ncbi:NAD(P)H-hydrate dehydratase [Deinococcus radiophilus]|uniref:Bifunctional NAD(P)H-hydrate repair enzyme n=1 Tax=Deinococcus radiophilus TaxID=32062 RepID=A0A3S0IQW1_9DEIO|nr:NAD(P)H-hydrate dehydratase [Deinococcus radiophilus]RTR29415.1 NAD(P)H-hydrate dehydratase [Deinococcus radiophilus]UFA50757.1 NAD(P)H-hydrate dehydratase [Deinococcus radiophilus]
MTEYVLSAVGVKGLDARLEAVGLLDPAMEAAGRAVAAELLRRVPAGARPLALLAGPGANGGDALVAARHLLAVGQPVMVLAAVPKHELAQRNLGRLRAVGGKVEELSAPAVTALPPAAAWADGLLGTGLRGPLRGELAEVVEALNTRTAQAQEPVLAIDLPSGLEADRITCPALWVRADWTLALSAYKPVHLFGAAAAACGDLSLDTLALPLAWTARQASAVRPADAELGRVLPHRRADAHKGDAGRVWVIGGSVGLEGAPAMTGVGALRTGAGLVTLHSVAEVPLVTPELMRTRHDSLNDWLAHESARPDALALGMGLGAQAPALARQVLAWKRPSVLDADALQPELSGLGHAGVIWTPHPGEAARMLEVAVSEVTADSLGSAAALQQRYGGVVVLKGGPSVVAWAGGLSVSRGGHPGMASAGMGDTLAGVLAALLAAGLPTEQAAQVGVRLHARAGERAAQRHGYGLGASDVAAELGRAWADLSAPSG